MKRIVTLLFLFCASGCIETLDSPPVMKRGGRAAFDATFKTSYQIGNGKAGSVTVCVGTQKEGRFSVLPESFVVHNPDGDARGKLNDLGNGDEHERASASLYYTFTHNADSNGTPIGPAPVDLDYRCYETDAIPFLAAMPGEARLVLDARSATAGHFEFWIFVHADYVDGVDWKRAEVVFE